MIAALLLGMIGGEPSSDPAVVCISAETLPICSGALIAADTVLTAGHCANIVGTSLTYFANFGPDCHRPVKRLLITGFETHPGFTKAGAPHDLALARLGQPAEATPIDVTAEPGATLRRIGYGISDESASTGWGTQRAVTTPGGRSDDDFLYFGDAGVNSCSGDSGGPVLSGGAIVAVMSDGPDCHSESRDARIDLSWPALPRRGCGCAEVPFSFAPLLLMALRALTKTVRQ